MTKPEQLMVVFGDQRPDSLFLEDMYDPDIDGTGYLTIDEAQQATGKVVPKPGSLIIDRSKGDILFYVSRVDPVTYKATLVKIRILMTDGEDDYTTTILDYGNDRFMLYWDDRVKPTKLVIDSKLVIFGEANVEYRLVRYVTDPETGKKEEQIISIYLNSDEEFDGNRIPLGDVIGYTGAKFCTNCHTNFKMVDGDIVYLEVYNNVGMLSARITLHTKRATILNDLASAANPIMNFDATCLQMRGDEWYVYEKQDPQHLGIVPFVEYADNTKRDLVIDGNKVIIYGLEDFIPSFPGYKQKLMLKYYLNAKEQSPFSIFGGKHRYLVIEKDLIVVSNDNKYSLKVNVFPVWETSTASYNLKFLAYTTDRSKMTDVTSLAQLENTWDGRNFYHEQKITFIVNLTELFGTSTSAIYRQSAWITIFPYSEFQKYIIKDSENADKAYGVESSTSRRPVIHYDIALKQYFIPTSIFSNKEALLDSFYYNANPPYNPTVETEPPIPTHFTVRSMDTGSSLIMMPIEIDQYNQAWNIVANGDPSQLVGGAVIVEFLRLIGETYTILFGVPVDVYKSITGWNSVENGFPWETP